jgi:hypothetical protein
MSLELEVSKSFVRNLMLVISVISLTILGYFSSPQSEDHKPLLLSPSLARAVQYQHSAQKWTSQLDEINADLMMILDQNSSDLFNQDQQIGSVYGRLATLQEEVDGTDVPSTLENLHLLLNDTVSAYLDASRLTAQWISVPTQENHSAAMAAFEKASQLYDGLYQNPWLKVGQ